MVIATPLEAPLVARIAVVDERLRVRHEPDLLPPLRFPCDHRGVESFHRTGEQQARWRAMLAEAEVLFGLPGDSPAGLAERLAAEFNELAEVDSTLPARRREGVGLLLACRPWTFSAMMALRRRDQAVGQRSKRA